MKIRTDFVTNSSSSSYVLILAKVTDETLLKKWLETIGIDLGKSYEIHIGTPEEVNKKMYGKVYDDTTNILRVENHVTSDSIQVKPDEKVLVVDISNGEGDCGGYSWCDRDCGIDYDMFSVNDLPEEQQQLYNLVNVANNGLINISAKIGIGRDG
jgi:hypothetical protein